MNETSEMTALLEKMEKASRRQTLLMVFAAVACVGILIIVATLFRQLQPVVAQMETASANLTTVTEALAAVDFGATVEGLNDTIAIAQDGLVDGTAKLKSLDIETLNSAIADLAEVVEPLSKFFGVFNR